MVLTGLALLLGLNAVTNFTEKARGGVGLVLIIGFSLFTLGLFTWIRDGFRNESKMKKKRHDEHKEFEKSIKQEFSQAKVYISYYDPNDGNFLRIAKSKDVKEAQNKTNYDTSFLVVDFEQKQIVVGLEKSRRSPPEDPYRASIAFSDIVKAEMVRDGTQVATTNRGSQLLGTAVGAVALGGVGALIGGLSASKTTLNGAKRIAIRITVDNPKKPVHEVTFYTSKDKKGGRQGEKLFDKSVQKAAEFAAYLDAAIRETEKDLPKNNQPKNNQPKNNQSVDISEQISRLWQLQQEGALTQEEFEKQKAKLLQS